MFSQEIILCSTKATTGRCSAPFCLPMCSLPVCNPLFLVGLLMVCVSLVALPILILECMLVLALHKPYSDYYTKQTCVVRVRMSCRSKNLQGKLGNTFLRHNKRGKIICPIWKRQKLKVKTLEFSSVKSRSILRILNRMSVLWILSFSTFPHCP